MRAVVTGCAGFIGSHVGERLVAEGWHVRGVDAFTPFYDPAEKAANLAALRRAVLRLDVAPTYVLTDGFSVDGIGVPGLAVWKGDRVAACVAAASIVAKVTRDRIMAAEHLTWPEYAFDVHKGYCTPLHQERLDAYGPAPTHRRRFVNVRRAARVGDAPDQGQGKQDEQGEVRAS